MRAFFRGNSLTLPARFGAVVLVFVGCAYGSSAKQFSLHAVARYWHWRGGAAFDRLHTVHASGEINDDGIPGSQEVWMSASGTFWDREASAQVTTLVAVKPGLGWRTNLSGQVIPLSAYEIALRRQESELLFAGILCGASGSHIERMPDESFDAKSWSVFRVSFAGPDSYDFFVNADTGELHAIRFTQDRHVRFAVYSDWRIVDGVRMAATIEIRSSSGSSRSKFRAKTIDLNLRIPASLFKAPQDQVQVSFEDKHNGSGALPFDFVQGRRIFIHAEINGRPAVVLLDSGAEMSVISPQIARAAGIDCGGKLGVEGAGGSDSGSLCNKVSIQLGHTRIAPITAALMDLGSIGKTVGVPMEAILGQEVFNEYVVDIDFARHLIWFRDRATFSPPATASRLPLTPVLGNRVLPIAVERRKPVPVIFDLGNGSALDLFPSYWQPEHLLENRHCENSQTGGAGGKQPVHKCVFDSVSLGGKTFKDVLVNLTSPGATTENSNAIKGNVGIGILSRFHLQTDYSRNALYLSQ